MTSRIRLLPTQVINQIAAGEVIERAASVVKELLENALDAGADWIHIEIMSSGFAMIRVSDNGCGILVDDLSLAVLAHATSKISTMDDLNAILSMGFRGEALASIAAVSKFRIISKTASSEHAMSLTLTEAGPFSCPCARTNGTTVEVCDLFYNLPVRKKFLKSPRFEYQAIEAVVKQFALAEPGISISLMHDECSRFSVTKAWDDSGRAARIKAIFGLAFLKEARYFETYCAGMHLEGWFSGPLYQRSKADKQWIYLNRRFLKDKLILGAVIKTYQSFLDPGRHPSFLLYLTLPPDEIDVNVHPRKLEVRFQEPRLVHDFIASSLAAEFPLVPFHENQDRNQGSFQLAESGSKSPLNHEEPWMQTLRISNQSQTFFALNDQFLIFWKDKHPYLVDVHQWIKEKTAKILHDAVWPLAGRSLLVPVSWQMAQITEDHIHRFQLLAAEAGIVLDLMGKSSFLVRTIPEALPWLNIERFMAAALKHQLKSDALQEMILSAVSVQAGFLDAREIQELIQNLEEKISQGLTRHSIFMPLDQIHCRRFFHV